MIFEYDDAGNLIKETYRDEDGDIEKITEVRKNGPQTETITTDSMVKSLKPSNRFLKRTKKLSEKKRILKPGKACGKKKNITAMVN